MKKFIFRLLVLVVIAFLLIWVFGYENTFGWVLRRDYEVVPGTGVQLMPCIVFPILVVAILFVPFCYVVGGVVTLWLMGWVIKFSWNFLADSMGSDSPFCKLVLIAVGLIIVFFVYGLINRIRKNDWA